MYTLCKISICSLIYLFVSEWKRQVVIEQTWFLYFLVSEFKSEDIYSRVNYCGKNVCGNFPLWELIFADHWKNCKKATILCHTTADWCILTCYLFVSSTYVQLLSTENYRCYTVYQYFDSSFFIILLRPMCSHTFSTLWQPCRLQISKRFLWQWNKKCIGNFRYKRDKIKRYLFAED